MPQLSLITAVRILSDSFLASSSVMPKRAEVMNFLTLSQWGYSLTFAALRRV